MTKILKYFIMCGAAATMASSCDMNLLPKDYIVYEEGSPLFLTENDIAAFQNGVIASYRSVQYGVYTITSEVQCDGFNATRDFGNNYGAVHRCDDSFTTGDYDTENMWSSHYAVIKNYNIAIDNAELVEDEALKPSATLLKGMAHFCRASSYLTLARHFAKDYDPATASEELCVPLVLHYNQLEVPVRATVEDIYATIYMDLYEAEKALKQFPEYAGVVGAMYPTLDAVYALMARWYLDTHEYGNAAYYAEQVIKSAAGYTLSDDLVKMSQEYTDDYGTEPIIQLYASPTEGAKYNTVYTYVGNDDKTGKYFAPYYLPTAALVNAYDNTDIRFATWFTNSKYPVKMSGSLHNNVYVFTKYLDNPALHAGDMETGAHAAKPLMIGEMYLIAAEAYAMEGEDDEAKRVLNLLQKARQATLTDGSMENVKLEWFKETVGEGHRLSCIKRWGDSLAARTEQSAARSIVMTGAAYNERALDKDSHYFNWPVPDYEIKLAGKENLVQNDGYAAN